MLTFLSDDFSSFPFAERMLAAVEAKKNSILLVPEQLALSAEKQVAESFPACTPLYFEVSNFSRLADRVFRTEGGISYRYADHAAETVLMWKTLDDLAPILSTPRHGAADTVKEQLAALAELATAGVTAEGLRAAARRMEDTPLQKKVTDLATISDAYEGERRKIYGSLNADLEKLHGILKEKPLFKDTEIYVFGFTSFTAGELAVLGELMRAGEVFIALSLPRGIESGEAVPSLAHEEVLATYRALLALAERVGSKTEMLAPLFSRRSPMLSHAVKELFRADGATEPYKKNDGTLSFITAKDPYAGCAHIAAQIARAVRHGARYRDFTVVTRAPEKYDGILDEALAAEGIPFFFSIQTDLTELSLTKMILSAYACIDRGFQREDLIAYLKCGFAGISDDDCDLFELYTEVWRIKGQKLLSSTPFDMNPRGYADYFTETDTTRLARINAVRDTVLQPLLALRAATEGEKNATDQVTALYHFLTALNTERQLLSLAEAERARGRVAEADRLSRLTGVIYDLLDRIHEIMGETKLSRTRFTELLSTLFSSVSLGTLPTSNDAVTVANADTYRSAVERTVFLLGVVEGEFPASIGLDGIFPEAERQALEEVGVTVGKPPEVRASREQFSFLRAIASAKDRAIVIAFTSDALGEVKRPASVFLRLEKLLPNAKHFRGAPKPSSPQAALDSFFEKKGTPEGDALTDLFSCDENLARSMAVSESPIHDPHATVTPSTAASLFPDDMQTSQTRLEGYLNCAFAYYLKNAVRLEANEPAAVRSLNVGNMIHDILENFFTLLEKEKTDIRALDPARIPKLVEDACKDYISRAFPASMCGTPRLSHLLARVQRAAVLVTQDIYDEFLHSRFTPAFCELDLSEDDGPGALVFRDADGKSVSIGGRIDRVDTYRDDKGNLFVRVVDYKTGSRVFSREELAKGRNLQMFIYLCAIWKSECDAFLERLNLKEGEHPIPAGIIYNTVDPKTVSIGAPKNEEDILLAIRKGNFSRRGFFLNQEAIIRAMDDDLSHLAIPKSSAGINFEASNVFGSLIDFGLMLDSVEKVVLDTAHSMRSGYADAKPYEGSNPCAYCPYVPVCRKDDIQKKKW